VLKVPRLSKVRNLNTLSLLNLIVCNGFVFSKTGRDTRRELAPATCTCR
jgi:hypothetical protein